MTTRASTAYGPDGDPEEDLDRLLGGLLEEVPAIRSVAVVSADGLLLLSSDPAGAAAAGSAPARGPRGSSADLATVVSGLASLTAGAARLMRGGVVKQTMVAMDDGNLFVTAITDGSLLGVHTDPDCDTSLVAYHMALFAGRAGRVLGPELRGALGGTVPGR